MENGNSYVVRERGGGRGEEAREEGGAEPRPRPPQRVRPRRELASSCCGRASGVRSRSSGPGRPEDASAWSSFQEQSCLQPLSGQSLLLRRRLCCDRLLQQLPGAGRTWRREGKEAGEEGRKELLPVYPPGGVGGWRGVPGSPPPPDHPSVQGATARTRVRGARVAGQAMSLTGEGNEPMWNRSGLARTAISHQLFPILGASWVSPSRPPPEG